MSDPISLLIFREPVNAWSHGLWLLLSIPATIVLWTRCRGDRARRLSLLVFGLSLSICYAGSMLFHAVRLPRVWIDRFDAIDHIGIFVLIAGSYTPVAWNLLDGRFRWGTLAAAWSLSAFGTACLLIWGVFSMFWSTCLYMVLGWGAVVCYYEMARSLSHRTLSPLLIGGILYTTGAVINLAEWPILWPGVIGNHELFHFFVMAGSLAHFWFMLAVVATPTPFPTPAPARVPTESLADPCRPMGYCQPMVVHASPDWGRERGG
jgi:hemolysin III